MGTQTKSGYKSGYHEYYPMNYELKRWKLYLAFWSNILEDMMMNFNSRYYHSVNIFIKVVKVTEVTIIIFQISFKQDISLLNEVL